MMNSNTIISDERLSAFLDGELSAEEMAQIREQLAVDSVLSERLAQLGSADSLVRRQANAMDAVPIPESITRLLQTNNVVQLSGWRKVHQTLLQTFHEHAAIAAGVALVIGFVAGEIFSSGTYNGSNLQQVATYLDATPSGERVRVAQNTTLLSRFSFLDAQQRLCRQYVLHTETTVTENVACRGANDWELLATARASSVYRDDEYRTASGTVLLDSTLNALSMGQALSLEEESQLLSR